MRVHLSPGFGILLLSVATADAQTLTIDHRPVACATAERFPRLDARLTPAESVAAARVFFQGQTADWYSVPMKLEGAAFAGVLPKPKKDLKSFRYYIEVTGTALGTSRTPEYTTSVVEGAGACKGGLTAGSVASASVLIQSPAGAVALPVGFAPAGVVAGSASGTTAGAAGATAGGGGGLSGAAIAGIAAGGVAVAGVAVAASKGGDSTSASSPSGGSPVGTPTPAPTPAPTPTPAPPPAPTPTPGVTCPACYAGPWILRGTLTSVGNPSLCGSKPGDVGHVDTASVTFTTDGNIIFGQGADGRGVVDSQGNFKLDFDGDPPGSGLTCPPGGATGKCTTVNSCSGSGSQGGDTLAIVITRQ